MYTRMLPIPLRSAPVLLLFGLYVCIMLTTVACDREERVAYYWNETQCADPWEVETNAFGADSAPLVTSYLESRGIKAHGVGFDGESPLNPWCEACTCGTERRIIVTVDESDGAAMENLGFYR